MTATKRCPDCGLDLLVEQFRRNSARGDGLAFYCTACFKRRDREAYERRRLAAGHSVRRLSDIPDGHKRCTHCQDVKPVDEFHVASRGRGRHSHCKPCRRQLNQESHLRRAYGLDRAALERLISAQGGVCAVCRERPAQHVDHDHLTGAVRGVLCFNCNGGLGQFKDRADVMRKAIDYLERTTWQKERVCTGVYRLTTPRPAAAASPSSSGLPRLISSRRG